MSYSLSFWNCSRPLGADEAAGVYRLSQYDDSPEPLEPHPRVGEFWDEIMTIYPPLEELSDAEMDASPWCGGEFVSDCQVGVTLQYSEAQEMSRRLLSLSQKHGLATFDPQSGFVYLPPQLRRRTECTLNSPLLMSPFPGCTTLIADLIPRLSGCEDPFAVLEQEPQTYIQTMWTEDGYLLEFRDGHADRHYQAVEKLTAGDVSWALQLYAGGDRQWRHEYRFERFVF